MTQILTELNRSYMNAKNKRGLDYKTLDPRLGRNRYYRRMQTRMGTSVNQLNRLDMNKLFKDDILDINLEVLGEQHEGETRKKYTVRISFGGFLNALHAQLKMTNGEINLTAITRALVKAFNGEDVYVRCDCPDFIYRHAYWLSVENAIAGEKEDRPNRFDRTNKDNVMGCGCKHIAIALSNNSWLIKTGNVIKNYIMYMEKHQPRLYAEIIYPAIYEKQYEEPVQQDLFDTDDLQADDNGNVVDTANKWARTRTQFQKGNEYRFRPSDQVKGQQEFDFDSLADEEETGVEEQ